MHPDQEPSWKLLLKSVVGIAITFVFSLVVLGGFVRLIDGGGSWWFTGHHLVQGQWYEAVRNAVATVALSVAGGAAYLAYRRQRTADLAQQTAAEAKQIAANAQQTAADAQALAVKRRDDDEVRELRARFSSAAEHLAHPSPAVRIAGVYAMTALAEDWTAKANMKEAQVCIDVLCGYLRLPYAPEHGDDHHSKLVIKRSGKSDSGGESDADAPTFEEHYEYRPNDRQVRQTIVRVIVAHLGFDAASNWSGYDFDFQGAHLEDSNFSDATFSGKDTSFRGVTFSGENTLFNKTTFSGQNTWFIGATFRGRHTSFVGATFTGGTWFTGAKFGSPTTWFNHATFGSHPLWFTSAIFMSHDTSFQNATFRGYTHFGALFRGNTSFDGAAFSGKTTLFDQANFSDANVVSFVGPRAWDNVHFPWGDDAPKPKCIRPIQWPPEVATGEGPSRDEPER